MKPSDYIKHHELGEKVSATVLSCHQYGCHVELKEKVRALIEIIDFTPESLGLEADARIRVEDLPEPGQKIDAHLYLFGPTTSQIRLTMWEHKLG